MRITLRDGGRDLLRRRSADARASAAGRCGSRPGRPATVSLGGVYRFATPIYLGLRQALNGSKTYRTGVHRSLLPCRVDVLSLLIDIDRTSAGWLPDGKGGTLGRLRQLAGKAWRPQDCDLLGGYTDRLDCWVLTATELLRPTPRVFLAGAACPCCGARSAYVRNAERRAGSPARSEGVRGRCCVRGVPGAWESWPIRSACEAAELPALPA